MLRYMTIFGMNFYSYDLVNSISVLILLILWLGQYRNYKKLATLPALWGNTLKKNKSVPFFRNETALTIYEMLLVLIVHLLISLVMNRALARLFKVGGANYFGTVLFGPIGVLLVCLRSKVNPLKVMDILTPPIAFALCISKIACALDGCCYGYQCDSFYYNNWMLEYEFPVQLVEAGCALVFFFVLTLMKKFVRRDGIIFPSYLIMYSVCRFFSEFARADFPSVLGDLVSYQLQCIAGAVIGVAVLIIVLRYGERISAFTDRSKARYTEDFQKRYNRQIKH